MLFKIMLFDISIYIYYKNIHSAMPDSLKNPPHVMINECNPLTELIKSIEHFSSKAYASDGRKCREKFTHTSTNIKKRKKSKNKNYKKHKNANTTDTQNIHENKQNYLDNVNLDLNSIAMRRSQSKQKRKEADRERSKKKRDTKSKKKIPNKDKSKRKSKKSDKEENNDTDDLYDDEEDILGAGFDVGSQQTFNVALDNLINDKNDDIDELNQRDIIVDRKKNKNKTKTTRRSLKSPTGKRVTRRSHRLNAKKGGANKLGRSLFDQDTQEELDDQEYDKKLDAFYVCYIYLCILHIIYNFDFVCFRNVLKKKNGN